MPDPVPSEVFVRWAYVAPALVVVALGGLAAWVVAKGLGHLGWTRLFWHPPLAFLGFWVLVSSVVGLFFLPL